MINFDGNECSDTANKLATEIYRRVFQRKYPFKGAPLDPELSLSIKGRGWCEVAIQGDSVLAIRTSLNGSKQVFSMEDSLTKDKAKKLFLEVGISSRGVGC